MMHHETAARATLSAVASKRSPKSTLPKIIGSAALTQEDFDTLLDWLGPDRERAGLKYEEIRGTLVNIFSWRGYYDAEDLADEAMNRVVLKVKDLSAVYVGDPAPYFYGVAKKITFERDRREEHVPLTPQMGAAYDPAPEDEADEGTRLRECLQTCLRKLSPEDRELILSYYQKRKREKIDYRKSLAEELGIDTNALRVRVYRIRAGLKTCIKTCVKTHRAVK